MRTRLIAIAMFVSQAFACGWDLDTLAAEARGLPGVAEIIVGHFDRWPPEVYESRLVRVEAELVKEPDRLDLYDDAGVACDRLGLHDQAVIDRLSAYAEASHPTTERDRGRAAWPPGLNRLPSAPPGLIPGSPAGI